jgi:hypothetical protein
MDAVEERIKKAMTGSSEEIWPLLRDSSEKVLMALLANRNISDEEVVVLARRRNISGEVLGMIAGRKRSPREYEINSALVNNPKTPRRVSLGILRRIRPKDLAFVTQNKMLPTELRQAAEGILKDKLPTMPLGVRITLSRQVSEEVVKFLLLDYNEQLVKACFENPRMKESVVLWAVNHERVPAEVIEFIASHPRWSACYSVKFAMIRNKNTPADRAIEFARGLKSSDLRFLYNDPSVPVYVKVEIEILLEKKEQPLYPPREAGRPVAIPDEDVLEAEIRRQLKKRD